MRETADYGSNDRHRHGVVKPELTGRGLAVRMRARDGCELDRLAMKGHLNAFQHSAGSQLARDLHGAKLLGLVTVNFDSSGGGAQGAITDRQADAMMRVGSAIDALDGFVGVAIRRMVVDVCLSALRVEGGGGLARLRQGLDALLTHYDQGRTVRTVFTVRADALAD